MAASENNLADYNRNPDQLQPLRVTIPDGCAGLRLDQALSKLLPQYSRSRLQEWIKSRRILLAGQAATPKQNVWGGETVEVRPVADPAETSFRAEEIDLDIVYEDDALLVVNKAPGMVVHPASGNWEGTLLNALLHHAPQLAGLPRAGIVHRLDKDTSGLLVVAKTLESQTDLVRQLQARTVKRVYFALVQGFVERGGTVEAPVGRHPQQRVKMAVTRGGKPAVTHYEVVEWLPAYTLVRCSLETGRTHQIRVHMQSLGYPLAGDTVYGGKKAVEIAGQRLHFPRQALHAARLGLIHPVSGKAMEWRAPLPEDFEAMLEALRQLGETLDE